VQGPPPAPGQHTREALEAWGFESDVIEKLIEVGAVLQTG
jgi:crotonobetainyl-CoA:carnitine CoA-transferase CaiB-like acyl-CoA transferase